MRSDKAVAAFRSLEHHLLAKQHIYAVTPDISVIFFLSVRCFRSSLDPHYLFVSADFIMSKKYTYFISLFFHYFVKVKLDQN